MLTTLFGGAVLIVVLYYVLRRLKLPNYWCGVMSAAVPMAAYSVLAARDWPGLDVVTMHVTVFAATAVVLSMINGRRRAQGEKLHWAPKLFIGFFAVLFVLLATFAYIATNGLPDAIAKRVMPGGEKGGIHTAFAGVVPHGEDAAKGISEHLKERDRQNRLGWQIAVENLERLSVNHTSEIKVRVQDVSGAPLTEARVQLILSRPAQRAADIVVSFAPSTAGVYRAGVRLTEPGQWHAVLRIEHVNAVIELEQPIVSVSAP
jgi:nitrogen fixation protein FixH